MNDRPDVDVQEPAVEVAPQSPEEALFQGTVTVSDPVAAPESMPEPR